MHQRFFNVFELHPGSHKSLTFAEVLARFVLGFVVPCSAGAITCGGATDPQEVRKIEKMAPAMAKACPIKVDMSRRLEQTIARNVLFNETACKPEWLIEWADGEKHPSLGLPHAVWYSAGEHKAVDESFPAFWQFLRGKYREEGGAASGVVIPDWLDRDDIGPAPWRDAQDLKEKLAADKNTQALFNFLRSPKALEWQARYVIQRGLKSANKVLATSALENNGTPSPRLCAHLQDLFASDQGVLTVVDYVNFKGEGIDPQEIRGDDCVRWGLKQVLEDIDAVKVAGTGDRATDVVQRFARSARRSLFNLTHAYADPKVRRKRQDWLEGGWEKRIKSTYENGGVDASKCPMIPSSGTAPGPAPQSAK